MKFKGVPIADGGCWACRCTLRSLGARKTVRTVTGGAAIYGGGTSRCACAVRLHNSDFGTPHELGPVVIGGLQLLHVVDIAVLQLTLGGTGAILIEAPEAHQVSKQGLYRLHAV